MSLGVRCFLACPEPGLRRSITTLARCILSALLLAAHSHTFPGMRTTATFSKGLGPL